MLEWILNMVKEYSIFKEKPILLRSNIHWRPCCLCPKINWPFEDYSDLQEPLTQHFNWFRITIQLKTGPTNEPLTCCCYCVTTENISDCHLCPLGSVSLMNADNLCNKSNTFSRWSLVYYFIKTRLYHYFLHCFFYANISNSSICQVTSDTSSPQEF